jgi:hypothetical protein
MYVIRGFGVSDLNNNFNRSLRVDDFSFFTILVRNQGMQALYA